VVSVVLADEGLVNQGVLLIQALASVATWASLEMRLILGTAPLPSKERSPAPAKPSEDPGVVHNPRRHPHKQHPILQISVRWWRSPVECDMFGSLCFALQPDAS